MTTHASFMALMVTTGIITNTMNSMEPFLLNRKPWYPYTVQLVCPSIIALGFVGLSYARNQRMRAAVFREVKEKCSYYFRWRLPWQIESEASDY